MGDSQTLVAGGVGTGFTVALFVVYRFLVPLLTASNHKRIRSVCCGKNCESSLDVEDTTPVVHTNPRAPATPKPSAPVLPPIKVDTPGQ